MKCAAFLCALPLLVGAAEAQPKNDTIETVIVSGTKPHAGVTPGAIAHDFVRSFATPTVLRDSIARWQTAICPEFDGIPPQYAAVMEARLRAVAKQAGAAMKDKGCRPDLYVIFTAAPQAMLDALRTRNSYVLGYKGAALVTHPIQAWYETGITDLHGYTWKDQESWGLTFGSNYTSMNGPQAQVAGWRFHPDAVSALLSVTILVDTEKTSGYTVGEIGDYVAMMALSRSEDYGDCQLMPSIANLLSPDCDAKLKPSQITATDIAYLRGVYRMDAGANLQIQQDQIAGEMAKVLGGGE